MLEDWESEDPAMEKQNAKMDSTGHFHDNTNGRPYC